jgi:hypothetical protein
MSMRNGSSWPAVSRDESTARRKHGRNEDCGNRLGQRGRPVCQGQVWPASRPGPRPLQPIRGRSRRLLSHRPRVSGAFLAARDPRRDSHRGDDQGLADDGDDDLFGLTFSSDRSRLSSPCSAATGDNGATTPRDGSEPAKPPLPPFPPSLGFGARPRASRRGSKPPILVEEVTTRSCRRQCGPHAWLQKPRLDEAWIDRGSVNPGPVQGRQIYG